MEFRAVHDVVDLFGSRGPCGYHAHTLVAPAEPDTVCLEAGDNLFRHLHEEQIHLNSLDHADARNLTEAFRQTLCCGVGLRRQPEPESSLDVGVQLSG